MTQRKHNYRLWVLLAASAAAGCAYVAAGVNSRHALYYIDPMHPAYRSDRPGRAPDCGMELTPVYADAAPPQSATTPFAPLRLETETVKAAPVRHGLHTVGRVVPKEDLTYRVAAGVDGWVRRVFSDETGTRVTRGQPLAKFFSKDASSPQQAFVYALDSYARLKAQPSPPAEPLALAAQQLAIARDNLRFVGMGDAQIEQLGRTRQELYDIDLTAPAGGWILERHISAGHRFMKGELLYGIANLEQVWVLTQISPSDLDLLDGVRTAHIRMEGMAMLEGRLAGALPLFDKQGRTGELRLEVENPGVRLVPGMIVDVEFDAPARLEMTVPADAVIDSGKTRRVFVANGKGEYEMREIETGREEGGRIEIRNGLKPGERVVTAGAFLLDSETRIRDRQ